MAALTQPQGAGYMLVPGNATTARKVYYCIEIHEGLGTIIKRMLFIHAFMVCDTVSAFYINSGFNKLQKDHNNTVEILRNPNE